MEREEEEEEEEGGKWENLKKSVDKRETRSEKGNDGRSLATVSFRKGAGVVCCYECFPKRKSW